MTQLKLEAELQFLVFAFGLEFFELDYLLTIHLIKRFCLISANLGAECQMELLDWSQPKSFIKAVCI